MSKICNSCNAENVDEAKFCRKCGGHNFQYRD
jgi:ribosomal protein L40E